MKVHNEFDVSVIIVNFHVKKDLFLCIESIINSSPKKTFEIIVIDNDDKKTIKKDLKKKYPKCVYIPNDNRGFGHGNNIGAKAAKGEYLFFLNPDTKVFPECIDSLANYLKQYKDVGIVAPLLYDEKHSLYLQGAKELTPVSAIFSFSFINKLFPNNPFAKKYWMLDEWNRKTVKTVSSIPGTAFMIRREIFEKMEGFDERFFLYFEEHDLCKRVSALGWKIVMIPQVKVFHKLGASTRKSKNINRIFQQSRFYYLRKHFGLFNALWAECILRTSKYTIMLTGILLLSFFLMTYRLAELMPFIGDQGWFYLSARDMVINGEIPLVGIPSSRPWLHQGAYWTYMLAGALAIGQFHPLSGAYLTILLGLISIVVIYKVGQYIFSQRVGLIAALLFATSPLVITLARIPYHTAPIPLFTLIFIFCLYQWVRGKPIYLPLTIFTLAVLYNFQISTFLLTIVFLLVAGYGLIKQKEWFNKVIHIKYLLLSILAYLIPMLPMLLYDLEHGFPQTFLFLTWIGYKIATVFGYPSLRQEMNPTDIQTIMIFLSEKYKRLVYAADNLVAFTLALFSFGFFFKSIFEQLRLKNKKVGEFILGLLIVISIAGIVATKTASDAYLPILYPAVILITALFFDKLIAKKLALTPLIIVIIVSIAYMNITTLFERNYFSGKIGNLADRTNIAKEIVTKAEGSRYNLVGMGDGSQFESFTMNYEYLTWWLGHGPSDKDERLKIIITESNDGINVDENIKSP